MTVTTNEYGVVKLEAEPGMAICRVGESGPTTTTTLYLAKTETAADYKDCAYGVPTPPRTFSKLKIVVALTAAGVWDEVKAWLIEANFYDFYLAAQDFREDNPYFSQALAALKPVVGWTDEQIEALLLQCMKDDI